MPFRIALFLVLLLACTWPAAAEDSADHSIVYACYHQHYTVASDDSYLLDFELVKHIAAPAVSKANAEQYVNLNDSLDQMTAIEVWTGKPDERQVPVGPQRIREQPEAVAEAPMFQDTSQKVVIFPDVAQGDTVTLRYTLRRHTPLCHGVVRRLHRSQLVSLPRLPADL